MNTENATYAFGPTREAAERLCRSRRRFATAGVVLGALIVAYSIVDMIRTGSYAFAVLLGGAALLAGAILFVAIQHEEGVLLAGDRIHEAEITDDALVLRRVSGDALAIPYADIAGVTVLYDPMCMHYDHLIMDILFPDGGGLRVVGVAIRGEAVEDFAENLRRRAAATAADLPGNHRHREARRRQKAARRSKGVWLYWAGFALFLFIAAGNEYVAWKERTIAARGVDVEARVVAVKEREKLPFPVLFQFGPSHRVDFTFADRHGDRVAGSGGIREETAQTLHAGGDVAVRYLPDNPALVLPTAHAPNISIATRIACALAALAFLVAGVFSGLPLDLAYRDGRIYVLSRGELLEDRLHPLVDAAPASP